MEKTIILNVIAEDFENAGSFDDCNECLLSTAFKRQFNLNEILVSLEWIKVNIFISYKMPFFGSIKHDKAMSSRKPFSVTLTLIE